MKGIKSMIQKLKKKSKRVLAFILSLITILTAFSTSETTVFAADGTLHFNSGESIPYGDYFTTRMTFDGANTAYCLEPLKKTPETGNYQYNFLPQNSPIRKALYYLNGGYGYETITKEQCFHGWSDTDSYVIGHLALAYIFDNYNEGGGAFHGAPASFITKTKEVVDVINSLPSPPKSFRAFILPADNHQTLAGSWYEKPYGWIELYKSSANGQVSDGNGNYSLKGAKYGIYQGDSQVAVLTTNEDGYAKSGELEEGSYIVREIEASSGYAIDTKSYDVTVKSDVTETLKVKEVPKNNPIDLVLQKIDAETKQAKAQGAASLENAEFTIKFFAEQMDTDPEESGKKPIKTWVFRTDKDGKVKFTKEYLLSGDEFYYQLDGETPCLPLGTVTIQETKAPEGYFANENVFVQKIVGEGAKETVSCYHAASVPEQIFRGDLEFVKVADGELNRLANIPFAITSKTTGESHTIVTDKNGYASTSSEWVKHTQNTNQGVSSSDGIWFGTSQADDSKGALLYDTYVIEEQRCKENEGMDLLKFEVTIYKDSVVVQLGTLTNDKIEIGTTAVDKETDSHLSKADEKVTIIDTVEYEGLKKGQEYQVVGTLMDRETGEPVLIDGHPVTSEKTFKAKKSSGMVEVTFTFNGVSLKGKTVVVFEELYHEDLKLAVHADIDDEDQTIFFPEIGSTAKDSDTEDHIANADSEVTLIDTVAYKNLVPAQEYRVVGTLMDKKTGEPLEADGKPVTAETVFTTKKSEGTTEVMFVFDGTGIKGKTVVVFETVLFEEKEVAVHADISYEGQTVFFPEIGTTAKDTETNSHVSKADEAVTIVDTVSYKNLVPGKEYKVSGVLMDKETGKELLVNEEKVTAETVFTPEKTEGTVEVTFTFDGSMLNGKTIVAFETVMYQEKEVAIHTDIEDKEQSIYFPLIHTTAKDGTDGDKEIAESEEITLVDTVEYKNLEAGQEYKVSGVLMDKATGEMLFVQENPVTAETAFKAEKAEGKVDVTFTFDATGLANRKLVVFEKLYIVGEDTEIEVTNHEDMKDEGQTVKVVEKEKPKPEIPDKNTPKTGDDSHVDWWILLSALAAGGITIFSVLTLKKNKKKDKGE